jgi:plasmid stabilization system protein ParE
MVREIIWTKRANHKFNRILEYLEQEWGEQVTRNFIKRTYEILQLISEQPEVGTLKIKAEAFEDFY